MWLDKCRNHFQARPTEMSFHRDQSIHDTCRKSMCCMITRGLVGVTWSRESPFLHASRKRRDNVVYTRVRVSLHPRYALWSGWLVYCSWMLSHGSVMGSDLFQEGAIKVSFFFLEKKKINRRGCVEWTFYHPWNSRIITREFFFFVPHHPIHCIRDVVRSMR